METIGKLITLINRIHQRHVVKELKDFGFGSGTHHSYLLTVLKRPGLSQEQITSETKFDKATTTRSVKMLEEAGYIERVVDEKDRRSFLLYPTERAKAFEPHVYALLQESNKHLTRHLTEEERVQLQILLQKLFDGIKDQPD